MPFRLKSHTKVPPGSFRYTQTEGISHKFDASPLIAELASKVTDFRTANALPRANYAAALEDIDSFNCERLGNMSNYCYNTDRPFNEIAKTKPGAGCGSCGVAV